jgi:hypothetical protein
MVEQSRVRPHRPNDSDKAFQEIIKSDVELVKGVTADTTTSMRRQNLSTTTDALDVDTTAEVSSEIVEAHRMLTLPIDPTFTDAYS